jgi:hypothetical protein
VLLCAMALPTATFLSVRSFQSQSIDWLACLAFGLPNLLCYCAGLWFLLNVLVQSGTVLIHALGIFILFFAIVRIAADCNVSDRAARACVSVHGWPCLLQQP